MAKSLVRSRENRVLGGVCGGIADYFDWDANIVRIVFLVSLLFPISSIWIYLIIWLITPIAGGRSGLQELISAWKRYQSNSNSSFDSH